MGKLQQKKKGDKNMEKQIMKAQTALAILLKELFLLPTRLEDEEMIIMFSNIIINQIEASYEELYKLIEECEK